MVKHGKARRAWFILLFVIAILLGPPGTTAEAFLDWQSGDRSLDGRGLIRAQGLGYRNPEDDFFYEDEREAGLGALGRLLFDGRSGESLGFELNFYQAYLPGSLASAKATLDTPLDVERSDALEWSFSDDDFLRLAIDRLSARFSAGRLDLTVGRQPVSLATTFYFTPNDFFAPFAAQTIFRVYKSGVDAARAEVRLGNLSQLSLISVLGYGQEPGSDTGWSDRPEGERTSYLGRFSTVFRQFEWALLGGTVRETKVLGGSLQGELFQWLGIRAEGHRANPDDRGGRSYSEGSLGVEHRWENSLTLRVEQFYHGSGADSVKEYGVLSLAEPSSVTYLARDYTALGADYEFTPLFRGEALALANWTDHSYLLSLYGLYSLTDEADLAVSLGIPLGEKPDGHEVESEFGLYPYSLIIEVRTYF